MKTITLILCASLAASGCATLTDTLGTKEAAAICSAADVVTTGIALHHGAVETNPITKLLLKPLGIGGFAFFSFGIVWLIYQHHEEWTQREKEQVAVMSAARCAVSITNLKAM